jgi:hypothetical protein
MVPNGALLGAIGYRSVELAAETPANVADHTLAAS